MYGLGAFQVPKIFSASSLETLPAMITSSPCFQLTGVDDSVLGGQLERIDHPQHLVEVAPRRHRIDEDQLDLLVRADDEHVPHGHVVGRRPRLGIARRAGRQHVVELGHVEVGVADDRVAGPGALRLLDVVGPGLVVRGGVDGQADHLDSAALELRLDARHVAQLGGAHGREVLGVAEQHTPAVAQPLVEADRALRGLGGEVGGLVAQSYGHRAVSLCEGWRRACRHAGSPVCLNPDRDCQDCSRALPGDRSGPA